MCLYFSTSCLTLDMFVFQYFVFDTRFVFVFKYFVFDTRFVFVFQYFVFDTRFVFVSVLCV